MRRRWRLLRWRGLHGCALYWRLLSPCNGVCAEQRLLLAVSMSYLLV